MQDRKQRPKFFNPFPKAGSGSRFAYLKGFFRGTSMHVMTLAEIRYILDMVAKRPTVFGFPDQMTCVANTSSFLPSVRSRQSGVLVFGAERGCKSLIIPPSCSVGNFDHLDAKLMEPLFRWNPSIEYVYLSNSCQPIADDLALYLAKCRNVKKVTLVDWTDTYAIRKVCMACKKLDTIDAFSIFHSAVEWNTEENCQNLNLLTEMHPKLRVVEGTRDFLRNWQEAVTYSRCKHNVALVASSCDYVFFWGLFWTAWIFVLWFVIFKKLFLWLMEKVPEEYQAVGGYQLIEFLEYYSLAGFLTTMALEWKLCHRRGIAWVWWLKTFLVTKLRLQLFVKKILSK